MPHILLECESLRAWERHVIDTLNARTGRLNPVRRAQGGVEIPRIDDRGRSQTKVSRPIEGHLLRDAVWRRRTSQRRRVCGETGEAQPRLGSKPTTRLPLEPRESDRRVHVRRVVGESREKAPLILPGVEQYKLIDLSGVGDAQQPTGLDPCLSKRWNRKCKQDADDHEYAQTLDES